MDASLGSIKAFIFDPTDAPSWSSLPSKILQRVSKAIGGSFKPENLTSYFNYGSAKDMQQVLFISGPEYNETRDKAKEVEPLLKVILQFPLDPLDQRHPSIVMFNLQEIRICLDPILFKWFLYMPTVHQPKTDFVYGKI